LLYHDFDVYKFIANRRHYERTWSFLSKAEEHNRPSLEFHQLFSKHIAKELRYKEETFILNPRLVIICILAILDKPGHVLQRNFPVAFGLARTVTNGKCNVLVAQVSNVEENVACLTVNSTVIGSIGQIKHHTWLGILDAWQVFLLFQLTD